MAAGLVILCAFLMLLHPPHGPTARQDAGRIETIIPATPTPVTPIPGNWATTASPRLRVVVLSESDGGRLPGVTVILKRPRESAHLFSSATDSQGAVEFALPALGRYDVDAVAEGDVINGSHSRTVGMVEALKPQLYELQLKLDPEPVNDIPLVSLRGSVRNNLGKFLSGSRVVLYGKRPSATAGPEVGQRFEQYKEARVTTDSKGLFALKARIWPGRCELIASHDECNPLVSDDTRTFDVNLSGFEGEFHFILSDWPSVRVAGRVLDGSDNPVPGARVDCYDLTSDGRTSLAYRQETGLSGEFEFSCRMDTCLLRVSQLGYQTQRRRLRPRLADGAGGVRVILQRSTATVHGSVVTKDGRPVSSVEFIAYEVPPKDEPPSNPPSIRFSTDSEGRFRFDCTGDGELIFAPVDQRTSIVENGRVRVPAGSTTITLRVTTIP